MIALLLATALAHHPDASARLGSGMAGGPGVVAPDSELGADLSLGTSMARFEHLQQGSQRTGEQPAVTVWTTQPSARVWLPGGVFVSAAAPIATVASQGRSTTSLGDVRAAMGVAGTVGHTDLWVQLSASAPTGDAGMHGAIEVLDIDTSGGLQVRTKDIRTQQGLGVWGLGVNSGTAVRWERWALRSMVDVRTPLAQTSQGIRWGWDVEASVGGIRSVGPVDLGLFADGWTHTPDHFYTDGLRVLSANRRHGVGLRPTVSVAVTEDVRLGGQVQVVPWQWVGGTQLTQGLSAALRATVRL